MPADPPRPIQTPTPIAPGRVVAPVQSLPVPLTPLVGREREVELAAGLLRTANVRLLTLSGPGGVGKTRLLLRLAEELADDFPGGVIFVQLAPITDVRLLLLAIAGTLGIPDAGGSDLIEQLALALSGWPRLLLLDNFEQVVEGGPSLTTLLAACPALKIAVTSRVVLRVTGEQELVVPPLAVPGAARSRPLEEIAASEAVALFLLRAASVNPAFELTEENAPAIVEVCRRLDGLPLAIELAAARMKVLSPQALAGRLGDQLQVLIGGPRDQPARLQTMRGAIAWSYDLLEPDEQALFRRLSVFPAGFDLDSAEQVVGSSLVLDGITSLVDKSLLQQTNGHGAEPRFTMLETIRAFASEQLAASGEEHETQQRHADWCRVLVADAATTLYRVASQSALNRVEREHDSVQVALGWLLDSGATEQAAEMVVDAWWFWFTRAHLTVGRAWSARVFAQLDEAPTLLWLHLNAVTGWFAEAVGEFETAIAMHQRGLALARELDDPGALGIALYALADVVDGHWEPSHPLALFREAEAIFRTLHAVPWLAVTLNSIGAIYREIGELDQAIELIEEGLALARKDDVAWIIAVSLGQLGRVYRMKNDLALAIELDQQAVRLWHDIGDWWRMSRAINELGVAAQQTGCYEHAARLLGGSEALREQYGAAFMPVLTLAYERATVDIQRQLGGDVFAAAWNAGRSLSLDELLDLVAATPSATTAPQPRATPAAGLSSREMEVLRLLVAGHSDRQIAETLFISHRTAQGHVGSIFNKLGVNSRTAAATTAIRLGLVVTPDQQDDGARTLT
jgi:non-specific serine/threonine protein kinase